VEDKAIIFTKKTFTANLLFQTEPKLNLVSVVLPLLAQAHPNRRRRHRLHSREVHHHLKLHF